ncbi:MULTISPECIES: monofunctional biosynthetic peptidoglycan transglycosylase [unclassified Yoonia]|uniref:monofunctional biosynthetic peptidoglycan transglycosylase n=1 Tax=unclassified Yoonia TaxID=2629118 RepID=UPI002AFF1E3F|nr:MULTISPECIES: monofunctional biosynthetic peptidoglycan transglycosylase [unclassified Yoonia]
MADTPKPRKRRSRKTAAKPAPLRSFSRVLRRGAFWSVAGIAGFVLVWTLLYVLINPPTNAYMFSESRRLGGVQQDWVPMERIAPVMARSAVAAEDANFCLHWGLDVNAIRTAMERGTGGASTISQQVVKNVFLWHGRSWARKTIEALWTPVVEVFWSKRRILEIYLNVAEFDDGVFGVQAAAQHYFGVDAAGLTATQAARLAAILPAPKERSASNPGSFTRNRAAQIISGAETIAADGRADCFQE